MNTAVIESRTFNLPVDNIDTDQIIPASFLTTTERSGLGRACFHAWRFNEDGSEKPDNPLREHRVAEQAVGLGGSEGDDPDDVTGTGERLLALAAPVPDLPQVTRRQETVRELAPRYLFRDKLALNAALAAGAQRTWKANQLIAWLEQGDDAVHVAEAGQQAGLPEAGPGGHVGVEDLEVRDLAESVLLGYGRSPVDPAPPGPVDVDLDHRQIRSLVRGLTKRFLKATGPANEMGEPLCQ